MAKNRNSKNKFFRAVTVTAALANITATAVPVAAEVNMLTDVQPSHPFYNEIMDLYTRGAMNGFSDGTFKPNEPLTRGQVAKIIANILQLDVVHVVDPGFQDISPAHQYYGAIAALKQAGIIVGYEDGTFRQGEIIQRQHVAKIIAKAMQLKANDVEKLPYTDVPAAYKEVVASLYENGIMQGKTATKFDGNASVTRAQIAVWISRAEKIEQEIFLEGNQITFVVQDYTSNHIKIGHQTYSLSEAAKGVFSSENTAALKGAKVTVTVENGVIQKINHLTLQQDGAEGQPLTFVTNNTLDTLTVNANNIIIRNVKVLGDVVVTKRVEEAIKFQNITINRNLIADNIRTPIASLNQRFAQEELTDKGATIYLDRASVVKNITVKANGVRIITEMDEVHIIIAATVRSVDVNGMVTAMTIESTVPLEITGNMTIKKVLVNIAAQVSLQINGLVEMLHVENPNARIRLGSGLNVNQLLIPTNTTVSMIIVNYQEVSGQIIRIVTNIIASDERLTEPEGETEGGNEGEGETESEAETEGEGETESEAETEGEGETESEVETEGEGETESEVETEGEGETESEAETEGEGEAESEAETEGEGETESEAETEGEGETESETEGEV